MHEPTSRLIVTIYTDGHWGFAYERITDAPVLLGQWALPLSNLTMLAIKNANVPIPTAAERAAAEALAPPGALACANLPDGWAAVGDVDLHLDFTQGRAGQVWIRRYRSVFGVEVDAPCAPDGTTTMQTQQALLGGSGGGENEGE